jgi:hypothetical protein
MNLQVVKKTGVKRRMMNSGDDSRTGCVRTLSTVLTTHFILLLRSCCIGLNCTGVFSAPLRRALQIRCNRIFHMGPKILRSCSHACSQKLFGQNHFEEGVGVSRYW